MGKGPKRDFESYKFLPRTIANLITIVFLSLQLLAFCFTTAALAVMAIASSSTSLTGTSHPQNGAIRTLASSNWKALRKVGCHSRDRITPVLHKRVSDPRHIILTQTMPAGNVVQDNSSRTSTKRKRDAKVGPTPLAVQAEAEEDTGSTSRTAADGNAKGKGKMQEVSLLSDDTLTGRKAE